MRSRRQKHSVAYNILQICAGIVLAAFLVLSDRAANVLTPQSAASETALRKDALAAGIHVIRLEYNHIVVLVNRVVKAF